GTADQRERDFPLTRGMSLEGVAGAPLRLDGRIIGSFSIGFDDPGALTEEQVQLMEAVSAQVAQSIERARLYDAQRIARSEAEEANAAKAKFLRVMSHDLRTPLNSILGYTELLQGGFMGALEPRQDEFLARIRASTEMMRTQIEEILEFARIEAGRIEIRPRDVAVDKVLDRIAAMLGPQASSSNIALVREPCPGDLAVRADEHRLVQVLMNLVNNAAKFTPAGGTIRILASAEGETVRLSVTDTGIGIPSDKLESIFEPFVQVQAPLRTSGDGLAHGLGLGLAISRELARAMGGDVTARGEHGVGSVFTFDLPRAQMPAPAHPSPAHA
ncbi:MAG TPA: GAF domain-containing sensor histidine kinase, partial [Longimicrobiales bacterium]